MKPTVYIETTIVGHLTSRLPADPVVAGQMLATRKWWDSARASFDAYASELVFDEASAGDPQAAAERLAVLATLPTLQISEQAESLASALLAAMALPTKARRDALHVGIAAANGIDYLLTWNCRHLANAMLRGKIDTVCRSHSLEPPTICTPWELMEVEP